jgi:hypothetical protein
MQLLRARGRRGPEVARRRRGRRFEDVGVVEESRRRGVVGEQGVQDGGGARR